MFTSERGSMKEMAKVWCRKWGLSVNVFFFLPPPQAPRVSAIRGTCTTCTPRGRAFPTLPPGSPLSLFSPPACPRCCIGPSWCGKYKKPWRSEASDPASTGSLTLQPAHPSSSRKPNVISLNPKKESRVLLSAKVIRGRVMGCSAVLPKSKSEVSWCLF